VAVVKKYLHSCRLGFDDKVDIKCGNNYIQVFPLSLRWIRRTRSIHKRNGPDVHFECASGLFFWFSQNGYNRQKWLVIVTFVVGDGRREEGHFTEPTAAASRSHRAA